jgi:DNA-binding NtrC family response regulator
MIAKSARPRSPNRPGHDRQIGRGAFSVLREKADIARVGPTIMANAIQRDDLSPSKPPAWTAIELIGSSAAIRRARELLDRAAAADTAVLLVGEPGTDLQAVARDLHHRRGDGGSLEGDGWAPFIHVACAEGDAPRLDRDLFGTIAESSAGDLETIAPESRLAAARGGTLFFDEITELPSSAQARLARILRDGEVRMQGARVPTAFRVIAAAPPAIGEEVHAQRVRADFYRRVSVTRIDLPPLRDRSSDVPELAACVLAELAHGGRPRAFTQAALALLAAMTWPGNLAELRGAIARIAGAASGETMQIEHVLPALQLDRPPAAFVPSGNLRDARLRFERDYIAAVLQHHGWRMADAAQTLGIQRPNLYRKARQLGIPIVGIE